MLSWYNLVKKSTEMLALWIIAVLRVQKSSATESINCFGPLYGSKIRRRATRITLQLRCAATCRFCHWEEVGSSPPEAPGVKYAGFSMLGSSGNSGDLAGSRIKNSIVPLTITDNDFFGWSLQSNYIENRSFKRDTLDPSSWAELQKSVQNSKVISRSSCPCLESCVCPSHCQKGSWGRHWWRERRAHDNGYHDDHDASWGRAQNSYLLK